MVGFRYAETLSGTFARTGEAEQHRRFALELDTRAPSTFGYLRGGAAPVSGHLLADGLAVNVPVEGEVRFALRDRRVEYDLIFTADDARPYQLRAARELPGMMELTGAICDGSGREIAEICARFDWRADLLEFLTSWRLWRPGQSSRSLLPYRIG